MILYRKKNNADYYAVPNSLLFGMFDNVEQYSNEQTLSLAATESLLEQMKLGIEGMIFF